MMMVDDKGMLVSHRLVPVQVSVRFRAFRPLVIVEVMLVMHVHMLVLERIMAVFQLQRIVCWPCDCGADRRHQGDDGEKPECRFEADRSAHPPGKRIAGQPAGVRQGELGRIERWAVTFLPGAHEQATCRGLDQG